MITILESASCFLAVTKTIPNQNISDEENRLFVFITPDRRLGNADQPNGPARRVPKHRRPPACIAPWRGEAQGETQAGGRPCPCYRNKNICSIIPEPTPLVKIEVWARSMCRWSHLREQVVRVCNPRKGCLPIFERSRSGRSVCRWSHLREQVVRACNPRKGVAPRSKCTRSG